LANQVVFTTGASHQRVGIAFAHEGFARVHWFRQFFLPRDYAELFEDGRVIRDIDTTVDSGIMFHIQTIPLGARYLDYRLIIDGLWTADPLNPVTVTNSAGIVKSRVALPAPSQTMFAAALHPGTFQFNFRAEPGEIVTVGGSFNNWDPFMFEMREVSPGFFSLTLPSPPGRFQYVFFHRGEPVPDPANMRRLYRRDGRVVSEAIVH
jgi:hypothetical protein